MRRTYIAIVSGQFTKCEANNDTPDRCHQNVTNLFQQLDREHRGWTDWQESATNPCDWVDSGDPPQQPGHPLALFTGGPVKPGVYATRYDHYSLARTLEDAFGVRHLAHARRAHAIAGIWR